MAFKQDTYDVAERGVSQGSKYCFALEMRTNKNPVKRNLYDICLTG